MRHIIIAGLFSACLIQGAQASYTYDHVVTSSPGVHALTEPIGMNLIEAAQYDLSRFSINLKLDPNTFAWDGTPGSESAVVKKILDERFGITALLPKLYARFSPQQQIRFNTCLADVVRTYQIIEAEGVFYRDLKSKMDKRHDALMGKSDYDATRMSNYKIVDGFFNIVEKLAEETKQRFTIWVNSPRGQKIEADKLLEQFNKVAHEGLAGNPGFIADAEAKLKVLRTTYKLGQTQPSGPQNNNNNNNSKAVPPKHDDYKEQFAKLKVELGDVIAKKEFYENEAKGTLTVDQRKFVNEQLESLEVQMQDLHRRIYDMERYGQPSEGFNAKRYLEKYPHVEAEALAAGVVPEVYAKDHFAKYKSFFPDLSDK